MHILVTGHTGFKGAWLTCFLTQQGHAVSGLSFDPAHGSLFERGRFNQLLLNDGRGDIRDASMTMDFIKECAPDVLIHLAAQPLVRESYVDPRLTLETNVLGTNNVLEGVRLSPSIKASLIITTDKVYRNDGRSRTFCEEDPLGGRDPYSASKAMADLWTTSWAFCNPDRPIAVARAGNVIGGGDTSSDRLFPDLIRSFATGATARLRSPKSVRPWQHVLDCLEGYVQLTHHLLAGGKTSGSWNIGPTSPSSHTVLEAASLAAAAWGEGARVATTDEQGPHEEPFLMLRSSRANQELGWKDSLSLDEAISWTIQWEKAVASGQDPLQVTSEQVRTFFELKGTP